MTKDFITYLLSFIGFVPIQQLQDEQLQEAVRDAEKCQTLVDSAFVLSSLMNKNINDDGIVVQDEETEEKKKKQQTKKNEIQSWLSKLSTLNLCQGSSVTGTDDPQGAGHKAQNRQYERTYYQSVKAQKQQLYQKEASKNRRNSSSTRHSVDSGKDLPSLTSTSHTDSTSSPPLYDSIQNSLGGMSLTLEELKAFQLRARSIASSLSHLRRSEQFAKANEVAVALEGMIRSLHLLQLCSLPNSKCANSHSTYKHQTSSFFFSMFALIILGQESLYAPTEVRQTIFYQYKFGRRLILEMSNVLKNFESLPLSSSISNNHSSHYSSSSLYSSATSTISSSTTVSGEGEGYLYWWSSLYDDGDWLTYLQDVCSKLAKYDITWEYRKEYQDVAQIAERYCHIQRRYH